MLYIPQQVRFDKSKLSGKIIARDFPKSPKVIVGASSDYLNAALQAAMQCLPQQQYGGCVPAGTQLPPPPDPNPCNAGNLGKITYVTLVPATAISAGTPWVAGTSASWFVRPDTGFKAEKIIIPALVTLAGCTVDSVLVQNNQQLSTPAVVPGQGVGVGVFFPTTLSEGLGRLSMQNCPPNSPLQVVLFNGSGANITASFNIDMLGIAS